MSFFACLRITYIPTPSANALRSSLPRCSPPSATPITLHFQALRHASRKAKPTPKPALKTTARQPPKAPVKPPEPVYKPLDQQLSMLGKPTLLYAKYPTATVVGCYTIAGLGLAWMGWTWHTHINDPMPGTSPFAANVAWVGIGVTAIVVLFAAYYPTQVVQKIYAHPVPPIGNRPATVALCLHRRPLLPLLPMKRIYVNTPSHLSLDEPLQPALRTQAHAEESIGPDTRSLGQRIIGNLTGAPMAVFDMMRSGISTKNFVTIRDNTDSKWYLHKDGWVWERRGLDRLLGVRKYHV